MASDDHSVPNRGIVEAMLSPLLVIGVGSVALGLGALSLGAPSGLGDVDGPSLPPQDPQHPHDACREKPHPASLHRVQCTRPDLLRDDALVANRPLQAPRAHVLLGHHQQ